MDRLARFAMAKAGLTDAIRQATSAPGQPAKPLHTPVTEAAELLLRSAEEAGVIRPGITADDLFLAIGGLWTMDPHTDWQPRATRLLDFVMDGLRVGAPGGGRAGALGARARDDARALRAGRGLRSGKRLGLRDGRSGGTCSQTARAHRSGRVADRPGHRTGRGPGPPKALALGPRGPLEPPRPLGRVRPPGRPGLRTGTGPRTVQAPRAKAGPRVAGPSSHRRGRQGP